MAITYVQSITSGNSASASSIAQAYSTNIGTGQRLLIVVVGWVSSGVAALSDISTVTDTLVTPFTNALFTNGGGGSTASALYWGVAPTAGGADTVSVAFSLSVTFRWIM